MGYYIAHAGTKLQKITVAGTVSDITLPAGVTVSATKRTKFAVLNSSILATYGPTLNLRINSSDLACYPMSIPTPSTTVTAGAGIAGVLTGNYSYKVSFAQTDAGTVVSESGLSSASNTVTLAAQKGALTTVPLSTAYGVNTRRIHRTTANGSVYFYAGSIGDNTTETYTDNTPDASLSTTAAETDLGNPAGSTTADYIQLLTTWKNRLWAIWSTGLDLVYYSGIDRWYAWSPSNYLTIHPKGQGTSGVTAFLKRRDELGVAKQRGLWKIVGSGTDSYSVIQVIEGVGVMAPESVVIVRDVAYFLAEDGVYAWSAEGIRPLVGPRANAWFTTDTYFNRSRFANAFGAWNQQDDTYELHLAAATSGTENRWVSYDLQRDLWLGPHKTDVTTPSVAGNLEDITGRAMLTLGGTDGFLYRRNGTTYEDGASAVDYDVVTAVMSGGVPSQEKYFGELTVLTAPQTSGTLTITPYVGSQSATAGATISHDLTKDRQRHRRLGQGRLAWLRLRNNEAVGCEVQGIEIVPVSIVGTR